jgi:cellulose synthase/poly-beta-1,6-N-acetylglucosamine synthase-like glycosyltransferase
MSPLVALALALVFWVSAGLVLYAYVFYPILIWALSRVYGRKPVPPAVIDAELPSVSVLVVAYNEEKEIGDRIVNALEQDYPPGMLEVVIASDGSSDRTNEIADEFTGNGVRLLDYPVRRGKATVLNDAFGELDGEVVVLSDANTYFSGSRVVRKLARWFRDPAVGAVCGNLVLTDPETGTNVDGVYWKYETFLKMCESRLGALLGANGAIYAIRRELFDGIPPGTVLDDFVIPLLARMRTGKRIVYDPEARADEETPTGIAQEFNRRARLGAGGFQSIEMLRGLLHPRHGWTAFAFWSHKLLRWACPFLLVAALVTNGALAIGGGPLYLWFLAGQVLFYALAVLGSRLPAGPTVYKVVRLTTMFASMNAALLVGFARWARGSQRAAWERTARVEKAVTVRVGKLVPRTIPLARPEEDTVMDLALDETQEVPALTDTPQPQPQTVNLHSLGVTKLASTADTH